MTKFYEVIQINATGDGWIKTSALVINPKFEGAGIKATQVGVWDGKFNENEVNTYTHIEPREFMIIGNATCIERKNPFSD